MTTNTLKIFTDGGARGNPGPAACAYVAYVNDNVFHSDSKYLGVTTNNDAEYKGVILALEYLKTLELKDFPEINFFLDSELVVKQLRGEYKVKDAKLQLLAGAVRRELSLISKTTTFTHVPRSQNKLADTLLNARLDNS